MKEYVSTLSFGELLSLNRIVEVEIFNRYVLPIMAILLIMIIVYILYKVIRN